MEGKVYTHDVLFPTLVKAWLQTVKFVILQNVSAYKSNMLVSASEIQNQRSLGMTALLDASISKNDSLMS